MHRALSITLSLLITAGAAAQATPPGDAAIEQARRQYAVRAARLAKDDVVGHFALARWATRKGLPRCARWELHEVLREAPDHAEARKMLGQAFHAGRWMPVEAAMRAQGMVRYEGQWMRKYDAARARAERERVLRLQHRANLLFARLTDPRASERAAARADLLALAKAEKLPALERLARRKAAELERYWRHRPATPTAYTGILSINATHSELLELKPFTTSLGVGAPVRLQLPRMKTVSIGTTIAAPLGFGR